MHLQQLWVFRDADLNSLNWVGFFSLNIIANAAFMCVNASLVL